MEIKQLDAEYTYEYDLDIVNIKVKQNYIYSQSIDFDVGVFLDFDLNDFPVNLEIIDASKRIGVEKNFLINPSGDVNIMIKADEIKLEVHFKNHGGEYVLEYFNYHSANLKILDSETHLALI
ncbi:MAG: hypothetical protein IJG09_07925 [Methanobrevibacter sp.]|nr:hypothetical protein [Methanobrevibacter sp.]